MARRTIRILCAAAVVCALGGCGGHSQRVASVGDRAITRGDVDRLLEHAREEARNERRAFPEADNAGYRALEREALSILVSRAQLEVAARRLGLTVSEQEVSR